MANNSSEYMKDCFADAVIQLLNDYSLNDIQIKQICNLAGYHRASWFRAFRSKSEAVTYHMVRLWQLYCERHGLKGHDDWVIDNAEAYFQYNYEIRDTLRLLHRRGLMDDVAASFQSIMYEHHREEPRQAYRASMYAYSLFGMLYTWVVRDFDTTPEEMACILRQVFE